jgi:hypothetical protein
MKKLLMSLVLLSACAQLGVRNEAAQIQQKSDEQLIHEAQDLLTQGKSEEALSDFQNFSKNKRSSIYYLESRLGETEALLKLEKYNEALSIGRDVSLVAANEQPAMAARAFYLMSFAYEAQGNDLKAVASLLDAYRLKRYLSVEIGLAEVPARLAGIYGRQGRDKEAARYLGLADKGLQQALAKSGSTESRRWLAKTYYQMGSVTTNQLSSESYSNFIDGQRWIQVYLLRSLKQNDPQWSQESFLHLQKTYRDLLKVVELERNRQTQYQKASELAELISQAELYKPLNEHTVTAYEGNFYFFLTEVRRQNEKLLYEGGEGLSLTDAAKERNSLKKLPRQPKKMEVPPEAEIGEDPNL